MLSKLNPLKLLQKTARLLRLQRNGILLLDALDDAQAHPTRYRDPSWWQRTFTAARALYLDTPLPESGRQQVSDFLKKVGMFVGAGTVIVGALVDPQVLAVLPAKAGGVILSIAAILGVVSGYLHPTPPKSE